MAVECRIGGHPVYGPGRAARSPARGSAVLSWPAMADPLLLVTGFGPFPGVERNPSRELAEALALAPPPGLRVRAVALPVSFRRAPLALDAALADPSLPLPDLLLGLGVHRGPGFRFEARARAAPPWGERLDVDGAPGGDHAPAPGPDLRTSFHLPSLLEAASLGGALATEVSEDAGAYVCERLDRHLLERGRLLARPALFLHVPPLEHASVEASLVVLRTVVHELGRQVAAGVAGPPVPG